MLGVAMPMVLAAGPILAQDVYWLRLDDLRVPRPRDGAEDTRPKDRLPPLERAPAEPSKPPAPAPSVAEPVPEPEPVPSRWQVAGQYKALAAGGRTSDGSRERYSQLTNRLRLKLGFKATPQWLAKVEHDTEILAGNYVRTQQFRSAQGSPRRQFFGGGSVWLKGSDVVAMQSFHRAYVQYAGKDTTVIAGRQRVPLGSGRFWSTLDMLNPINAQQVEREEFVGVDALFVERGLGSLSKAVLVLAPDPARRADRWVAQYRTHRGSTDVTLTLGRYWRDSVVGLDFASNFGDAALRGELAYTREEAGGHHRKGLIGADYVFQNTFSVSAELYYTDQPLARRLANWQRNPLLPLVQPYGSAYMGLAFGYDFTPLVKGSTYVLANLKDGSRMLYPTLEWSIDDNSVLTGGAQLFHGSPDSEYGRAGNVMFLRFQQFF